MRNAVHLTLVVALLGPAVPAVAGKVGFVEVERALVTVQEGKAKFKELESWAAPRKQQLEELGKRVNELQRQLAQQRAVAKPEALKQLEEQERDARRRLEDAGRDWERELDARQTELLRDVARKINQVVTDLAKAEDYDAVFIMKDRTLVYLAPSADLTDTVIRQYDERFPVQP